MSAPTDPGRAVLTAEAIDDAHAVLLAKWAAWEDAGELARVLRAGILHVDRGRCGSACAAVMHRLFKRIGAVARAEIATWPDTHPTLKGARRRTLH